MVKCPKCNQETRKDLERCQYCNAELPKSGFGKFLNKFLDSLVKHPQVFKNIEIKGAEIISENGSFRMIAEDIFSIVGRGDVITGKIQSGIVRVNDDIVLISKKGERVNCKVKAIEKFRKILQEATIGDSVGLLVTDR